MYRCEGCNTRFNRLDSFVGADYGYCGCGGKVWREKESFAYGSYIDAKKVFPLDPPDNYDWDDLKPDLKPDPYVKDYLAVIELELEKKRREDMKVCAHGYRVKYAKCPQCAVPASHPKTCPWCGDDTVRRQSGPEWFTACTSWPACTWSYDKTGSERAKREARIIDEMIRRTEQDERKREEERKRSLLYRLATPTEKFSRRTPPSPSPVPKPPKRSPLEQRFANLDLDLDGEDEPK